MKAKQQEKTEDKKVDQQDQLVCMVYCVWLEVPVKRCFGATCFLKK